MQNVYGRLVLGWGIYLGGFFAGMLQAAVMPPFLSIDERPVGAVQTHLFTSYADVLEPAQAAVVSIRTTVVRSAGEERGRRESLEELFRRFQGELEDEAEEEGASPQNDRNDPATPAPRDRRIPGGSGSGVIVSPDGYVLTNDHVIAQEGGGAADEIRVIVADRGEYTAEVIGRDRRTDLALLRLVSEGEPFAYLPFADSNSLRIGDIVFAIGNPLGVGQTSTMGIVSALGRNNLNLLGSGSFEDFIQTDAAINRGNSGGALIDAAGRLVGINTAIFSRSGGNIGIGFAIPARLARDISRELFLYGEVRRGFLGVSIRDIGRAEVAGEAGLRGVLIEGAQPGLPAHRGGLRRGDIIQRIDGQPVETVAALRWLIAGYRPDTAVEVEYLRDQRLERATVVLSSLEEPRVVAAVRSDVPLLPGLELEEIDPAQAVDWNLPETRAGVIVVGATRTAPHRREFPAGTLIFEVNGEAVTDLPSLNAALRPNEVNSLRTFRNGRERELTLDLREP